jgi:hypothetical protein
MAGLLVCSLSDTPNRILYFDAFVFPYSDKMGKLFNSHSLRNCLVPALCAARLDYALRAVFLHFYQVIRCRAEPASASAER